MEMEKESQPKTTVSDRNSVMGTAPIPKLMLRLAIPSVVAQLINVLYNIVDRMYIGHRCV